MKRMKLGLIAAAALLAALLSALSACAGTGREKPGAPPANSGSGTEIGGVPSVPSSEMRFELISSAGGAANYKLTGFTSAVPRAPEAGELRPLTVPSVHLGAFVTAVGGDVFTYKFSSVTLPASVNRIFADEASEPFRVSALIMEGETPPEKSGDFYACGDAYTAVAVPAGAARAYKGAWGANYRIYSADGVVGGEFLTADGKLIRYFGAGREASVPAGVRTVGEYAFLDAANLESVTAGGDTEVIGGYAFSGCGALKSAVIGDGVTSIEGYAFYGLSSLKSVTVGAAVRVVGASAFEGCGSTDIIVPASVETLGQAAFKGCAALERVTLTSGVTEIGAFAFSGCVKLGEISAPDSVTSLGAGAFANCSSLTVAALPGAASVGTSLFAACPVLANIILSGVSAVPDSWPSDWLGDCAASVTFSAG